MLTLVMVVFIICFFIVVGIPVFFIATTKEPTITKELMQVCVISLVLYFLEGYILLGLFIIVWVAYNCYYYQKVKNWKKEHKA